jgi:hypothetical protein
MANQSSTHVTDRESPPSSALWNRFESRTALAFKLAGALMIASVLVPIGLETITDWSWVSGLVLIGLAVMTVATGLLGLYPQVHDQARWLTLAGTVCALIAGAAGFGLVVMGSTALLAEGALGVELSDPKGLFKLLAFLMASGFSFGFLTFGAVSWRAGVPSRVAGKLLVAGGAVLFVPVVGELLQFGFGIGPPPWVLFLALALVSLDTLAVGYRL